MAKAPRRRSGKAAASATPAYESAALARYTAPMRGLLQQSVRPFGALAVLAAFACDRRPPAAPATRPATRPASAPAAVVPPPASVLDVLKADHPAYPTRAALDVPSDLIDAAKIILDRPAYVDPDGNLWLTHPNGMPLAEALTAPIRDHTVVVDARVDYVGPRSDAGAAAVARQGPATRPVFIRPAASGAAGLPGRVADHPLLAHADFASAQRIAGGVVVPYLTPQATGVLLLTDNLRVTPVDLPGVAPGAIRTRPALAVSGDGVWAWAPWTGGPGSGAVYIDAGGPHVPDAAAEWPDKPAEIIPLADGSVLVVALDGTLDDDRASRRHAFLKLVPAPDAPPTAELLRAVTPLARQLADLDPTKREAAQRALEAQGPAALPILESLREQLPPEAQVRIEALLGQRFAPTLGGLRLNEGPCQTLARFPGGGSVLRFDQGGTVGGYGQDEPERSVIPATVLIRPGRTIELIDPATVVDFVPDRQSIQSVGSELLISDAVVGPRRWVGLTLLPPLLPKELADFDTVAAIDARRRWLLTSAKRPGRTLLIDPTLPDPTPRLPVWTVASQGGVGWTDAGWPAVRRGDRLFVLEHGGWKIAKVEQLRTVWPGLPVAFDHAGRTYCVDGRTLCVTGAAGQTTQMSVPSDPADDVSRPCLVAAARGRLFVYTPDGRVHRYAVAAGSAAPTFEATFSTGVPRGAGRIWLDPAGRLVISTGDALAITFPDGRVPAALRDLILRIDR